MTAEAKERIRARAGLIGFDAVGFAAAVPSRQAGHLESWIAQGRHGDMAWMERNLERRKSVVSVMPEARSVVVVGLNYGGEASSKRQDSENGRGGLVARYAQARDYHRVLKKMLRDLERVIVEECGTDTVVRSYVDTGPVLERQMASEAGLGWQGKSTMLISGEFGTWLLIAEVLTSAEIEPDAPAQDRCGSCTRCMDACPTGAITEDYRLDARKCISYLTIELKGPIPEAYREAIGSRVFGCDDCLTVCPWNRFAREARLFGEHARPELNRLDLEGILEMDEAAFAKIFGGTPIRRLGLARLKRNAAVVLGNQGDPLAIPVLEKAARSGEPLVAEHACWALKRIRGREKALAAA